jgi:gliding motility-associated-like protein
MNYVCENEALRLGVEPNWSVVEWSSTVKGFLSNEDTIGYIVTIPDTISVTLSDGMGCIIQRNTALKISKPVVEPAHEAYQILKGESVQLSVSGGSGYQWIPVSGLDDPQVANPVASPLKTTEYVVTAMDSLGCAASARVMVMVEETAFVPNLFTPNRDASNDALKIYGLGQVTGFSFSIYNREGNRVYHTEDISDALQNGWNGTAGGVDQPAGVYYWNVEGQTATGRRLRLNGRNSGSIVLVR